MRQNWLSNRVFKSFDDIVDHCCYAWNTHRAAMENHVHRPPRLGNRRSLIVTVGISAFDDVVQRLRSRRGQYTFKIWLQARNPPCKSQAVTSSWKLAAVGLAATSLG
jgi:hypothetical protein